jgi:hypothetical protein
LLPVSSHSQEAVAVVSEIAPEIGRVLLQTLLEELPVMFPLLPSLCPTLAYAPVFGVPLPHVMQLQADKHPALKIPHFIHQGMHASKFFFSFSESTQFRIPQQSIPAQRWEGCARTRNCTRRDSSVSRATPSSPTAPARSSTTVPPLLPFSTAENKK